VSWCVVFINVAVSLNCRT